MEFKMDEVEIEEIEVLEETITPSYPPGIRPTSGGWCGYRCIGGFFCWY
ncbi:MAG: hypothetical protein K5705_13600 [Oscillospiraceae bacterium]|nr:hypothetical protein [Oscillospiraceae bacterium]MCR4761275.1 hypothetical protein [Oscillospiraceae bacterium]